MFILVYGGRGRPGAGPGAREGGGQVVHAAAGASRAAESDLPEQQQRASASRGAAPQEG